MKSEMSKSDWIITVTVTVILLAAFAFIMYPTITAPTPSATGATNIRYAIGADMSIVGVTFDVPAEATAAFVIYGQHSAQCTIEAMRASCPIDFHVEGGAFEFHIVE